VAYGQKRWSKSASQIVDRVYVWSFMMRRADENSCFRAFHVSTLEERRVRVHVHVKLPSRQDARQQVPWRHKVKSADL